MWYPMHPIMAWQGNWEMKRDKNKDLVPNCNGSSYNMLLPLATCYNRDGKYIYSLI